ncbi:MAG TPA: alpha/beta fold hydrolase [Methylomirabilota bacterium]
MPSKGEVKVGDTRIEFLLDGAGDAVVMIPGGGLDASAFEDLARRIAGAGFRSVAVNPRGVGASKGRLEGLTLHTLAGDVAAVIEALGAGPAHVLGHGFSNRVARCLAADRPDLVRSVALLAGVGLFVPETEVVKALLAWFARDTTEADCLEATRQLVADPAAVERVLRQVKRWPVVAAAQRAADRATPQTDWIEPPGQVPILVVQGLNDRVAPPEHGHAFRESVGARVHVADIPDAGHMVFLEQPELVADAVVTFLRRQAA